MAGEFITHVAREFVTSCKENTRNMGGGPYSLLDGTTIFWYLARCASKWKVVLVHREAVCRPNGEDIILLQGLCEDVVVEALGCPNVTDDLDISWVEVAMEKVNRQAPRSSRSSATRHSR